MPPKKKEEGKKEDIPEVPPPPVTGSGKFIFGNGATYDGEWEIVDAMKKRHGKGVFVEGCYRYEGQWVADLMHGEGSMHFESGAVYVGSFQRNQFHGKGSYTFADKTHYVGQWADNKMHGEGVFVDKTGREWHGSFYNGAGPGLISLE